MRPVVLNLLRASPACQRCKSHRQRTSCRRVRSRPQVDAATGTVETLAGQVVEAGAKVLRFRLGDGTVLDDVDRASLATWDIPVLADGTEVMSLPSRASGNARRGRHERYG